MLAVLRINELSLIKDCKNSCLSFMTDLNSQYTNLASPLRTSFLFCLCLIDTFGRCEAFSFCLVESKFR